MTPGKPRLLVPPHLAAEMERVRRASEPQGASMTPEELVAYVNELEAKVAGIPLLVAKLDEASKLIGMLSYTRAWELRPELFCARRARHAGTK